MRKFKFGNQTIKYSVGVILIILITVLCVVYYNMYIKKTLPIPPLSCPPTSCPPLSCPPLSCPPTSCPPASCPPASCPPASCPPAVSCPSINYNMFVYVCGSNTGATGYVNVWDDSIWGKYVMTNSDWKNYITSQKIQQLDPYSCNTYFYFKYFFAALGLMMGYKYMSVVHADNPPQTSNTKYYIAYGKSLPQETNICIKLKYNESDNPQPIYRNPYNGILSGYKNTISLSENNTTLGPYTGQSGLTGGNISTMVIYNLNEMAIPGFTEKLEF